MTFNMKRVGKRIQKGEVMGMDKRIMIIKMYSFRIK